MRACVEDMIDVETRVDFKRRSEYIIEDVTIQRGICRQWQGTRWWIGEVGVNVIGVPARIGTLLGCGQEGLVQVEYVLPIVYIGYDRN